MFELQQVFDWTPPGGATYKWNATQALRYVGPRSNTLVPLEDIKMLLDNNPHTDELDLEVVQRANLDTPLLVVTLPTELWEDGEPRHLVIDGWHRMAKAWLGGVPYLTAYVMDLETSEQFRIK